MIHRTLQYIIHHWWKNVLKINSKFKRKTSHEFYRQLMQFRMLHHQSIYSIFKYFRCIADNFLLYSTIGWEHRTRLSLYTADDICPANQDTTYYLEMLYHVAVIHMQEIYTYSLVVNTTLNWFWANQNFCYTIMLCLRLSICSYLIYTATQLNSVYKT